MNFASKLWEIIFINLEKSMFFQHNYGMPTPDGVREVWYFHGLLNFYQKSIQNFRKIESEKPMTSLMKAMRILSTKVAKASLQTCKRCLAEAPSSTQLNFNRVFEVGWDALSLILGVIPS